MNAVARQPFALVIESGRMDAMFSGQKINMGGHMEAPTLHRYGTTIMCQCHGSTFDIRTGAVIDGPATKALKVYEVQETEGTIRISSMNVCEAALGIEAPASATRVTSGMALRPTQREDQF